MKHPAGPASAMPEPSPRERETFFDRPIVLATIAVLLASYAFKISNFGSLALLVLMGAVLANLVVVIWRCRAAGADLAARQSIIVSLTLEGFLLSLAALLALDQQSWGLSVPTWLLLITTLLLFLRVSQQAPEDEDGEGVPHQRRAQASGQNVARGPDGKGAIPAVIRTSPAVAQPYRPLEIESPRPAPPALLFKDDPLHMFPPPPQRARFFVVAKNNDNLVKCEDACDFAENRLVYALADGASSSNFPRPWASLLARSWVENPGELVQSIKNHQVENWLEVQRAHWRDWIYQTWLPSINARNASQRQPLTAPEVAEDVIAGGASATLLGLRLSSRDRVWECVAAGDTCLFRVPASYPQTGVYHAFPLTRFAEFNTSPSSLSTIPNLHPRVERAKGTIDPGDIFFLATDALAAWILQRLELGDDSVWQRLLQIQSMKQFSTFVNQMRNTSKSQYHMNDDDTSLFIIDTADVLRN
jgi:hypothetical protein